MVTIDSMIASPPAGTCSASSSRPSSAKKVAKSTAQSTHSRPSLASSSRPKATTAKNAETAAAQQQYQPRPVAECPVHALRATHR